MNIQTITRPQHLFQFTRFKKAASWLSDGLCLEALCQKLAEDCDPDPAGRVYSPCVDKPIDDSGVMREVLAALSDLLVVHFRDAGEALVWLRALDERIALWCAIAVARSPLGELGESPVHHELLNEAEHGFDERNYTVRPDELRRLLAEATVHAKGYDTKASALAHAAVHSVVTSVLDGDTRTLELVPDTVARIATEKTARTLSTDAMMVRLVETIASAVTKLPREHMNSNPRWPFLRAPSEQARWHNAPDARA